MNLSSTIYALRWLISDTFRQSLASRVFWIMLGVSGLAIIFCAGISATGWTIVFEKEIADPRGKDLEGPNPEPGSMSILFGFINDVKFGRSREDAVRLVHLYLASWVAGGVGLLILLVWTASFLPEFLQPSSAVVLLAKPVPRWMFLFGKFLGVVLFVALQGMVFFVGTWLALGLKTGVWNNAYLIGWPLLVCQFAVFYSFSVLVAVSWRSTVACIVGVVLFWAICAGVNYGRYAALALPTLSGGQSVSPVARGLMETAYWTLPKPIDFMMMLEDSLGAEKDKATLSALPEFEQARARGDYQPAASLAVSLVFAAVLIGLAGVELSKVEY